MAPDAEKPAVDLEKILELDEKIDRLLDTQYRENIDATLKNALDLIVAEIDHVCALVQYRGPRNFDGRDREHVTVFSENCAEEVKSVLMKEVDAYRRTDIEALGADAGVLQKELPSVGHLAAFPMHLGVENDYIGVIGLKSPEAPPENHLRLLKQAASRMDTYIQSKVCSAERHFALNQINTVLDREGIHGIGEALRLAVALTDAEKGAAIYLEDAVGPDPRVDPSDRRVSLVYVEDGRVAAKPDALKKLNDRLGGSLIDYDMRRVDDSRYGMRTLGILVRDDDAGAEKMLNFSCMDLVNRYGEHQHNIGKLFLIGGRPLDYTDLNVMEAVALQIDTQITHYHEQKKALGRSLHPDQIDFFLKYPKIARWFFENPREEIVAMVFTDLCNYTGLTRKLNSPRQVIDGAKKWILKEKELTLKHGGFFDKEVGDCAVSLFGPPFGAISLDALSRVSNVDEISDLMRSKQKEPHVYAYHAVMYALDSLRHVKMYRLGDQRLDISVGIEVGSVAIGDLTGDIGKLTAMGDSMNMAARLQSLAKAGQIIVGPKCAELLEIYRKESYLPELPFNIEPAGEAELKGYDKPVPCFLISEKETRASAAPDCGKIQL